MPVVSETMHMGILHSNSSTRKHSQGPAYTIQSYGIRDTWRKWFEPRNMRSFATDICFICVSLWFGSDSAKAHSC